MQGLWSLLVAIRPDYSSMLDPWRPGWFRLAAVALVAAVVLLWYAALRRRVGPKALAVGGLIWLAVLAAVLAAFAAGRLLPRGLAGPRRSGGRRRSPTLDLLAAWCGRRPALVGGAVAVVVLAPTVSLFFPALGLSSGAAPAFVATMLAVALLPAFELLFPDDERRRRARGRLAAAAVPVTAVVLAVACAGVGLTVDRFDADHPVPSQLVYALDTDSGPGLVGEHRGRAGGVHRPLRVRTGRLPVDFPYLAGADVVSGPAERADLPAPVVETRLGHRGRREPGDHRPGHAAADRACGCWPSNCRWRTAR